MATKVENINTFINKTQREERAEREQETTGERGRRTRRNGGVVDLCCTSHHGGSDTHDASRVVAILQNAHVAADKASVQLFLMEVDWKRIGNELEADGKRTRSGLECPGR
jgi:hypothetical protein